MKVLHQRETYISLDDHVIDGDIHEWVWGFQRNLSLLASNARPCLSDLEIQGTGWILQPSEAFNLHRYD